LGRDLCVSRILPGHTTKILIVTPKKTDVSGDFMTDNSEFKNWTKARHVRADGVAKPAARTSLPPAFIETKPGRMGGQMMRGYGDDLIRDSAR